MKKMQLKDAVRNIKKRWVSFASVIVIAILGTSIFLSIGFGATALFRNGSELYDSMHFRNVELISTLLISEDDIDALKDLDSVKDAEPVWQAGAEIYNDDGKQDVSFITLGERINVPRVLEGRLPQGAGECVIEQSLAEKMQYRIGDVICDYSMTDDAGQYMLGYEYVITGIVIHPDHISRTIEQASYIIVTKDDFDLETLQGASMKAEIVLKDAGSGDRFSAAHRSAVSSLIADIEALAPERTPLTDAAVKKAAHGQIDNMERDYREGLERVMQETPEDTDTIEMYENNIRNLDNYRKDIDDMAPSKWIVTGEESNVGFAQVLSCGDTLHTLQMNFGMMFILIGALTILATVGKMVGEQRTQVGTVKALGFYNREILMKFLMFGVAAVVLGTVTGALVGRFAMEDVVLKNYNANFIVDLSSPVFDPASVLIVLVSGVVLTVIVIFIACRNLMKESARALMQPSVPKGASRARKDKKHVFGLYSRLILRNIRSDLKRVAVTVVCILGCCAMIGVGFTMKAAVNNCPEKQYSEIVDYDVEFKVYPYAIEELRPVLDEEGVDSVSLYVASVIVKTDDFGMSKLFCGDIEKIGSMYHLYDWKNGEPLPPTDEGVYIYRRLAETEGLDVGSELELMIGLTETATVKVAGVFENYIGMPVVMSSGYYESRFLEEYEPNAFLIRLNGADPEALIAKAKDSYALLSWTESDSERDAFDTAMGSINSVDALLIAIAAIMAGVVQLNLTNTYILQKKRELILMRINGFTVRELVSYLLREAVFTTVTGILLGVAAGCGIGYYIVRSVELPYTQFDRSVCVPAWLYAVGITLLFTVVINAAALQKVKKLKLNDLES